MGILKTGIVCTGALLAAGAADAAGAAEGAGAAVEPHAHSAKTMLRASSIASNFFIIFTSGLDSGEKTCGQFLCFTLSVRL